MSKRKTVRPGVREISPVSIQWHICLSVSLSVCHFVSLLPFVVYVFANIILISDCAIDGQYGGHFPSSCLPCEVYFLVICWMILLADGAKNRPTIVTVITAAVLWTTPVSYDSYRVFFLSSQSVKTPPTIYVSCVPFGALVRRFSTHTHNPHLKFSIV